AIVILAGLMGTAGARLIKPEYEVRATVWIVTEPREGANRAGPIRSNELLNSVAWIELFRSYRIVDEVVRKLALYVHPLTPGDKPLFASFDLAGRFAPGKYELAIDRTRDTWQLRNAAGLLVEEGTAADSVGLKLGFRWKLPEAAFQGTGNRSVDFVVSTPRETSIGLLA